MPDSANATPQQYMSTRQAAARLGVGSTTINRLIRDGELLAVKKTTSAGHPERNSPYLISLASVISYEQRRQQGA